MPMCPKCLNGKFTTRIQGLFLCLAISISGIYLLFGQALLSPNAYLFSGEGDGLKSYYCAQYHVQYDKAYWHTYAMNYPYGESVFFTDGQPLVSNSIKFLKNAGIDLTGYTIGIINVLLILSVLLAAIVLYALLIELGTAPLPAGLWAPGITFLSPQIDRLSGHLSLAYVFIIPLFLLLLIRYIRTPGWTYSILCFFLVVFSGFTHLYYLAFAGILCFGAFAAVLLNSEFSIPNSTLRFRISEFRFQSFLLPFVHFGVQFLLPAILLLAVMSASDPFTGRTTHPFGFLYYKAFPESVFLPLRQWYGEFFHRFSDFSYITWEGYSYVGITATIVFLFLFITKSISLLRGRIREAFTLTNNKPLNIFFWLSIFALVLACALPFRFGFDHLIMHLGPLQQLRASGRFAWIFFYVMNLMTYTWMSSLTTMSSKSSAGMSSFKTMTSIIILAASILLYHDAWLMINAKRASFSQNSVRPFHGMAIQNAREYQAILPLPYFHVGSENIWLEPKCDILKTSFDISLQTGLPSMGVLLGRTSIPQTLNSIALVTTPLAPLKILDDMPDQRDILLVVNDCLTLTEREKQICSAAILVKRTANISLYRISPTKLAEISASPVFNPPDPADAIPCTLPGPCCIYEGNVALFLNKSSGDTGTGENQLAIRFWLKDISEDLVLTSDLEVKLYNKNGRILSDTTTKLFRHLIGIRREIGLFEFHQITKQAPERISILVGNKSLDHKTLHISFPEY